MRSGEITEFQKRVYDAVSEVPAGRVTTYKLLADHIGCGSCQAVGQALKRNPFAPEVPCHRVIASDCSIGGFMGRKSGAALDKKLSFLKKEGVFFGPDGRLIDRSLLYEYV